MSHLDLKDRATRQEALLKLINHPITRLMVPLALLGLSLRILDSSQVAELLGAIHWPWVVAGLIIVQAQIVLSAWRWQYTTQRLDCTISGAVAVREYYLASLLNQILPGGVTGDVARVGRNRSLHGLALIGRSVIVERLAGQVVLIVITLAGFLMWPFLLNRAAPSSTTQLFLLVAGLAACAILTIRVIQRFGAPRWRRFASELGPALRQAWWAEGAWRRQLGLSLLITASYLGLYAVAALAVGPPLPIAALITIVPLTLMTMLLPISIAGWGVREAAAAVLWPLVGLSSEAGLASSLLYGVMALLGALPGLIILLRGPLLKS